MWGALGEMTAAITLHELKGKVDVRCASIAVIDPDDL